VAENFPKPATIEIEVKGLTAIRCQAFLFRMKPRATNLESNGCVRIAHKRPILYEITQLIDFMGEVRKVPAFYDLQNLRRVKVI
jgi:hypothetical protein